MSARAGPVLAIFLLVLEAARGVLTGFERNVLDNRAFGCEWQGGGIATRLLCNCRWQGEELYVQEGTIRSMDVNIVRIENCDKVRIGSNSVQNIRNLRRIELSNIQNLTLEESSLHWEGYVANGDANTPSLRVSIADSVIPQVSSYTFKGRINDVSFRNVTVENLASFAFSSLRQNQNILFEDSRFKNVQPQAFKKFTTEYLTITNCTFSNLPSRSFSELTVSERFQIQNSSFDTVRPAAFLVHNPKSFEVLNSGINTLDAEGFKVTTRGDVVFRNVVFNTTHAGAFVGLDVNFNEVPARKLLLLEGVTFNSFPSWEILEVNKSSFELKLADVQLRQYCDCKFTERSSDGAYDLQEIRCLFDEDEAITYADFRSTGCSIMTGRTTIIVIIVVVSLILLVIIVAVLVFYFRKAYASDKYGDKKKNKNEQLSMIVPDGRTYRETELHVIVERADYLTTDL